MQKNKKTALIFISFLLLLVTVPTVLAQGKAITKALESTLEVLENEVVMNVILIISIFALIYYVLLAAAKKIPIFGGGGKISREGKGAVLFISLIAVSGIFFGTGGDLTNTADSIRTLFGIYGGMLIGGVLGVTVYYLGRDIEFFADQKGKVILIALGIALLVAGTINRTGELSSFGLGLVLIIGLWAIAGAFATKQALGGKGGGGGGNVGATKTPTTVLYDPEKKFKVTINLYPTGEQQLDEPLKFQATIEGGMPRHRWWLYMNDREIREEETDQDATEVQEFTLNDSDIKPLIKPDRTCEFRFTVEDSQGEIAKSDVIKIIAAEEEIEGRIDTEEKWKQRFNDETEKLENIVDRLSEDEKTQLKSKTDEIYEEGVKEIRDPSKGYVSEETIKKLVDFVDESVKAAKAGGAAIEKGTPSSITTREAWEEEWKKHKGPIIQMFRGKVNQNLVVEKSYALDLVEKKGFREIAQFEYVKQETVNELEQTAQKVIEELNKEAEESPSPDTKIEAWNKEISDKEHEKLEELEKYATDTEKSNFGEEFHSLYEKGEEEIKTTGEVTEETRKELDDYIEKVYKELSAKKEAVPPEVKPGSEVDYKAWIAGFLSKVDPKINEMLAIEDTWQFEAVIKTVANEASQDRMELEKYFDQISRIKEQPGVKRSELKLIKNIEKLRTKLGKALTQLTKTKNAKKITALLGDIKDILTDIREIEV